jgi:hypothetical protein
MADQPQGNIQQNPKIATVGINIGNTPSQVKVGQLSWAINATLQNFDGSSVSYQNEQANEECLTFPSGYQVIGHRNIVEDGIIVFWLANPSTGDSEIGTASNCVYTTIVNAKCLNLSIHHPVLKSVYKKTNCGTEVYWTDGYNVRRYINLSKLPFAETLDCPPAITGDVDCNKLSVQPNFSIPEITITDVDSDGSLIAGTYQFAVSYSNALAESYTSFYSITNPLPVFDPNKITQDFNYPVGKSINVTISNIDVTGYYDYINVAVIKTVNNISSVELVGTYQITSPTKTISYTGQGVQDRLTIADIFEKYPIYNVAGDLTTAQDVLIWDVLTTDERISYQEIANTIIVNWQTHRLKADKPYANEINAVYKRGYMRDEIYPYEIVFLLTNGKQTDGFHIPGRTSLPSDLIPIAGNDVIGEGADECDPTSQPLPTWQVYNTGSVTGFTEEFLANCTFTKEGVVCDDACYEGSYQYGEMSYWESTDVYPCNPIYGPLQNKPIRHHKFPDSLITHIHDSDGYIYPIGVRINVAQIYDAIQNSSLTADQKAKIAGFKIVRGNRVNNKSVVAKGLIHNVGKYSRDDQTYYFPNYPYNDLRADPFIRTVQSRNDSGKNDSTRLQAFSTDESKQRWVFHSPDTHFYQPPLGNIIKLETAEYGQSKGHFQQVKNHSRYKFLSAAAYITSVGIGASIGVLSATIGISLQAFDGTAAFTAYRTLLDIVERVSPKINFAYQYNSIGEYINYTPVQNAGNKQRLLDIATYLSPGMLAVGDVHTVNNFQRESSVYLRGAVTLPFPSQVANVPEDDSRYLLSDVCNTPGCTGCENIISKKDISSYYGSIKRNFANQYGPLYSYETVDTGFQIIFPPNIRDLYVAPIRNIFGGDVFINKFAYKSKLPFFIDNRVSSSPSKIFPDESDISYSELGNIAFPNYWLDTDSVRGTSLVIPIINLDLGQFFGIRSNNLDCDSRPFFYQKGKIYLFAYGVPYFYVESEVNVDLRQAYNGAEGDFFPRVSSDIPDDWLQESYTSIQFDNTYWYNKTYSKQNKENVFTHIPDNFLPSECTQSLAYRAIFSEPQKDFVNYRRNNWLIYRPSAYYDFPQNYGSLTSLEGIENKQVLARFENKSLLYNALLTAPTSQTDVYLGSSLFSQQVPPLDYADTDLGFAGSQHKFFLKTEFGHVSPDCKRGAIFLFNGQQTKEITADDEVSQWFTQYLDFELKKAFPSYNVDNNYNGTGLTGVYDSKYNRLIVTKTDYKPINPKSISLSNNKFYVGTTEIQLTNTEYFLNYSFTASYDLRHQQWISLHTYIPNYYVGEANYFYSGVNILGSSSMWRHNTSINKYNNFYGSIHPYVLEYPYSYQYNDEILQNVKDYTKALRYDSWQSFIEVDDAWFNKAILYNAQQSSGVLKLTRKPVNNLSLYSTYPKYNTDSKEILYTKRDNFYLINQFWALNISSQTPNWIPSTQNLSIFKEINQTNMDYGKRSFRKAPLRAKDLKIRLILDDRDDTKLISVFQTAPSQQSYL